MSAQGYIKLHRQIQQSADWLSEPFTRAQAWIDILLNAAHKPHGVRIRGILINLDRGQLALSEREYAKRWKWSRGKVRRFIAELSSKAVHRIVPQKGNVCTTVTVLNYELYQGDGTTDGTTSDTTDGPQTDHRRTTDGPIQEGKEGKEGENGKKPKRLVYPESFESWYKTFPNKTAKKYALKCYTKALKEATPQELLDGVQRYIKSKPADINWCNPSTWLNKGRWEDEGTDTATASSKPLSDEVVRQYAIALNRMRDSGQYDGTDFGRFFTKVRDNCGPDGVDRVKAAAKRMEVSK